MPVFRHETSHYSRSCCKSVQTRRFPARLRADLRGASLAHGTLTMQLSPAITFRGIAPSESLETEIRRRIDRLETYYAPIMGCRVLVEFAERHHEHGKRFHVRIDLTVPAEEIVVRHDASLHAMAKDTGATTQRKQDEPRPERKHVLVAIREAFDIARRQLQDYARRQRGVAKTSARLPRGRIVRVFPIDGYGFIQAQDGHEVFFQKNSVLNGDFDHVAVGSRVLFAEAPGDKGPQASTVRLR
jgi:cold shock CspA family protein/ribosome-associated translation inhibitor RaiA